MQVEISEATNNELQRRAAAAGLGISEYLDALVLGRGESAVGREKPLSVEELRAMLQRSGARLERNGRSWRELIHEGHQY